MPRLTPEAKTEREDLRAKGLKVCPVCGETLPHLAFNKRTEGWDGLNSWCRSCTAKRYAGSRADPKFRARRLVATARYRAKRDSLPFDIDEEWMEETLKKQDYACAVTGLPFIFAAAREASTKAASPWAMSPDRIIPELGYTRKNTQIVCYMYNTAKGEFKGSDVEHMAHALIHRKGLETSRG